MAIQPQTDLRLLKVPLTLDNKNQLTFSNLSAQTSYFLGLPHLEINNIIVDSIGGLQCTSAGSVRKLFTRRSRGQRNNRGGRIPAPIHSFRNKSNCLLSVWCRPSFYFIC